jgi:lipopolysaccharide export LptBFGC system permease protein LptF
VAGGQDEKREDCSFEDCAFPAMEVLSHECGNRAITGVAVAVGIAVVYWTVAGLFEAMGNINQLPPVLAAWSPDLIFALVGGYLVLKVPT